MNFARLNHILIPSTKDKRDELRRSRWRWVVGPASWVHGALSYEGRALSVLLLMIAVAGLDVGVSQVYLLFSVLFGALVASFVIRPFFGLGDVAITVHAPPRVTQGELCDFEILVENRTDRDALSLRVSRPYLPWDGQWSEGAPGVARLPAHGRARVHTRARFIARGEHHIDPFGVAALVPLGLSMGPPVEGTGVRFTVVPRIALVTTLSLLREGSPPLSGTDATVHRAEAQELLGVRPYRSGDAVKHLHARTWARVGIPHVREFHEPRLRRVILALSCEMGKTSEQAYESVVSLAAGVAARLYDDGVRVDLMVDDGGEPCTIGAGRGTLDTVLERLASVEPRETARGTSLAAQLSAETGDDVGAVVVIAPAGFDSTLSIARELRGRGVPCLAAWVGERGHSPEAPAGVHWVDAARVASGEGVAL